MRKIYLTFAFLIASFTIQSQTFEIPKDIKLESQEDFEKSEEVLKQAIDWLNKTPINETPQKRKEVNAFVLKWIMDSPYVGIEITDGLAPLGCPDCLFAFLTGWTQYSIENKESKNKIDCAIAGIENTIRLYNKNKDIIGKNSDIEKLIKKQKKGKLEEYVQSKF